MIDAGAASLAVVYSDGNREINVGTVVVDPSLNFKSLLSLLSQMIGISPHQFSVYLAAVETDRKIPITAKVNLAAVRREATGHYFFVKRSKRAKKASANAKKKPPEKVMLLRRASAGDPPFNTTFAPPILGRADYEQRLMNFQMERDSFRMNMSTAINGVAVGRESLRTVPASAAICEDCLKANTDGIDAAFHLCVLDSVTVGFRSLAGPISRPAKIAGEDGA
ncbi:hypothetical protein LR48_Vigan02g013700 [Vigna angularis]|uniref:DUF7138 domain-containing protein n=3 Tax=Vigna TaxID=3913 RepID=A0A0L9TUD1_PHAAN|nr:uncharacterized protein LOC108325250 [Vigna angularis]XP_052730006.1 uncharacterized protein LOC108325250 [Vigna angularis]KAG2403559.1 uncharacterized protein HKW66_Vig0188460 [Vigna angularis]KOM33987.1 hypothetical protein LR48_Vigan02g013700 [Vigna angularis]BAT96558.1 hypothetical protein VIGAN_08352000 [Vigna angularis var. angularis]